MGNTCNSCKHYEIDGDRGWCNIIKAATTWAFPACPEYKRKKKESK